jgi:Protein of unknown function (DUF2690)
MGCAGSNAYSVASFNIDHNDVTVTLRYSDWCHANWTTLSVHPHAVADSGWFSVQNKNGDEQDGDFGTFGGATTIWTYMVNGVPAAESCVDTGAESGCTGWY